MITKIHFKLEILFFYFKKNIPYILVGLAIGSAIYATRKQILNLYHTLHVPVKIIGLDGLYTKNNLPEEVTNSISYGLTINSENDKPILSPLVISYDSQNNNLEYLFNLQPNLYWHSGKKFTSRDINYQFNGVKLEPISDNLIKISLDKPFSPILSLLSQPLFSNGLDGLGPYQVGNIKTKEGYIRSIELKPKLSGQGKLIYRFYPNEIDLIRAFQLGEVDEIRTTQLPSELTDSHDVTITPNVPTNQRYLAVFFNTDNLKEKQLRQSLAYATPKTRDKNERCLGPISANSWAYNSSIKEYNFNPTRAKELFQKNPIDKIRLTILDRRLLPQAEIIKDSWQKILKINCEIVIENQLNHQEFEAILAYGGIPHDPDQYYFWHSTQTESNITKLNNSRIDKLLEEGRQITDPIERKKIYQDFQKYLLEEMPAVFLNYPTTYTTTRT